ncbi:MFS transporter [Coraliomargarita sp. W4R53]
MNTTTHRPAPLLKLLGYVLGEGAVSITMNGIANFAMLYYTLVLGLGPGYAGLALSITLFWDALTDPVMGHLSDNTRSRFGRRHPYMLIGGILLAASFYLLWVLPAQFSTPITIFWCVLLINLVVRTAVTIFVVPYTALGFEMCPEYADRSRLQGIRYCFNMLINLVFGAFAWTLFFKDQTSESGSRVDGTAILDNYLTMGGVLSTATLVLIVLCILATWSSATDNRKQQVSGNSFKAFRNDMMSIFKDKLAWFVFGFFAFAQLGMMLTAQIQMFTYVFYMEFTEVEKTSVHGGGMIAFALGALALSRLNRRFDKKPIGITGIILCVSSGLSLLLVFTTGLLDQQTELVLFGKTLPLSAIVFGLLQSLWWGGCGILVPLAVSMIADVSELNERSSGVLKNGSYAAVFSFCFKAAAGVGMFITGRLVEWSGFISGSEEQTAEAVRNISILTFSSGPIAVLFSLVILWRYPINRAIMEDHKEKNSDLSNS